MKFETLKKDNKKKIAIGVIAIISIVSVLIFAGSFAKYKLTQSIPLANGTINYKAYDFKVMAMYQQKDGSTCTEDNCYNEINTMPSNGYKINEAKSYCTLDNKNKDTKAILKTINGNHTISNLSRQDKCYLYFDILNSVNIDENSAENKILEVTNKTLSKWFYERVPDFSKNATTNEVIFKSNDNEGDSYYYRGAATTNYIKFANKWWRIIRINGDGTIRIIYDGKEYHANGTNTNDSIIAENQCFSSECKYDDNAYVGFMYGATGQSTYATTHANTNKSNALIQLEKWYEANLVSYEDKIDKNAGFCGDRTVGNYGSNTPNGIGGFSQEASYYGPKYRAHFERKPTLECQQDNDLYTVKNSNKGNKALTYPIGLITTDEVSMAGGLNNVANSKYYLYNGQSYWTMSPNYCWLKKAFVYAVSYSGGTFNANSDYDLVVSNKYGIRPVINLRADVSLTGSGTGDDPYVVVGAE